MNSSTNLFRQLGILNLYLLLFLILILITSCKVLPQKFPGLKVQKERTEKVEETFNASLERIDESIQNQKEMKISIDQRLLILEEKFNKMEIEERTYTRLKSEYGSRKNAADETITNLEGIKNEVMNYQINSPSKRRYYKEYELESKTYLSTILEQVNTTNKTSVLNYEGLSFYDDLLESDLAEEFELSVFFPSGVYQLDQKDLGAASAAFSPLVNRINEFINKYPDKSLSISIMTKGYADSQAIRVDSNLGKKLSELTTVEDADSKELNRVLSELRAKEISIFIFQLLKNSNDNIVDENKYQINMKPTGMGEEFPNPNITDYTKDDRRRRIVTLFWDVLPIN